MAHQIPVKFHLELTLRLTPRQARQATSDAFEARLRSALQHSTAKEALSEALDADVERLALAASEASHGNGADYPGQRFATQAEASLDGPADARHRPSNGGNPMTQHLSSPTHRLDTRLGDILLQPLADLRVLATAGQGEGVPPLYIHGIAFQFLGHFALTAGHWRLQTDTASLRRADWMLRQASTWRQGDASPTAWRKLREVLEARLTDYFGTPAGEILLARGEYLDKQNELAATLIALRDAERQIDELQQKAESLRRCLGGLRQAI
jgi:hypothetical protein